METKGIVVTWSGLKLAFWKLAWLFPTILVVGLLIDIIRIDHRNSAGEIAETGRNAGAITTGSSGPQSSAPQPATWTPTPTPTSSPKPGEPTSTPIPAPPITQANLDMASLHIRDFPTGWYVSIAGVPNGLPSPPLYCGSNTPPRFGQDSSATPEGLIALTAFEAQSMPNGPYIGQRVQVYSPGLATENIADDIALLRGCHTFTRMVTCPASTSANTAPTPTPALLATSTWYVSELSLPINNVADSVAFRIWTDRECQRTTTINLVLRPHENLIDEYYVYSENANLSNATSVFSNVVTAAENAIKVRLDLR